MRISNLESNTTQTRVTADCECSLTLRWTRALRVRGLLTGERLAKRRLGFRELFSSILDTHFRGNPL